MDPSSFGWRDGEKRFTLERVVRLFSPSEAGSENYYISFF